ncbi:MAG: endo-1,3-alpha-glucanase family glycosylhydrolase [Streptosporangiaceae bacterium]
MTGRTRALLIIGVLTVCAVTIGMLTVGVSGGSAPTADAHAAGSVRTRPAGHAVPVLAYYYIWFNRHSWTRAKIDYPALGRYSSGNPNVMRRQIEAAKSAGIDGFIVSWKDTPTNDRRLRTLATIAGQEHFKLAMIYEGLDFYRHPLPVAEVEAGFEYFLHTYGQSPVFFRLRGKPLTIWSGTWKFSHADVARVTRKVRSKLLILNTEKNVTGFLRLADVTDGDAYYWSSVNPATNTYYGAKLIDMSKAVHQHGEYWIAPFAPGFDARLLGGKTDVRRLDGRTLRTEYATATRSYPDVLGLISWNEFSENTYVEPSQKYGSRYLDVLRQLPSKTANGPPSAFRTGPGKQSLPSGYLPGLIRLIVFVVALVIGLGIIGYVRQTRRRNNGATKPTG